MPPRASKRVCAAPATSSASSSKTTTENTGKTAKAPTSLAVGSSSQTSGTTDLPVELFYEILSHFDSVPFYAMPLDNADYYLQDLTALGRQTALRTLPQTSRSWRASSLPLAWESVELAAARRKGRGAWYKQTSQALIKVGNGLADNPELAGLVRNIRVVMSKFDIDSSMAAFVAAMQACPNLRTVSVYFAHADSGKLFKSTFKELSFPSVEALIIPRHAMPILATCPNVKKLLYIRAWNWLQCHQALQLTGNRLEVLAGICLDEADETGLKQLVDAAPNLKELRLDGCLPLFSHIKKLKNLRRIELERHDNEAGVKEALETRKPMLLELLSDCTVSLRSHDYWYGGDQAWATTCYIPPAALS